MFDTSDKDLIIKLINQRGENVVFPLYVKIYNNTYSLLELDEITSCSRFSFKVGFGSENSPLDYRQKVPYEKILGYENKTIFTEYDEEVQIDRRYIVFETRNVEDDGTVVNDEINYYYDMLFEYVMTHVEQLKQLNI